MYEKVCSKKWAGGIHHRRTAYTLLLPHRSKECYTFDQKGIPSLMEHRRSGRITRVIFIRNDPFTCPGIYPLIPDATILGTCRANYTRQTVCCATRIAGM